MKIIIETERLILREYTKDDFDALYKLLSDPITMKHYPKPYDENGTRRWLDWSFDNYNKYGFGLWAAEIKETGEFIGDCGSRCRISTARPCPKSATIYIVIIKVAVTVKRQHVRCVIGSF